MRRSLASLLTLLLVSACGEPDPAPPVPSSAAPADAAWPGVWGAAEYSPLMEANVVFFPDYEPVKPVKQREGTTMAENIESAKPQAVKPGAIGFIETQGYTAVIEAIDTAVKAADVSVLGREKLGGGFITGVIGILIQPWRLLANASVYIDKWLIGYSLLLGAVGGVLIADYFVVRRTQLDLPGLYRKNGPYWYWGGFNPMALVALVAGAQELVP